MELGFLVVIPTVLVLTVAIISHREIEPLILGCLVGAVLLGGSGFLSVLIDAGYVAMTDPGFTMVAIVSFGFAGLIGLINSSLGAKDFAIKSTKFIKGERSMGFVTWLLCWALFVDDYMHAMVVSATMKDIADKFNVPRKVLTYIASATAASMAVLIPTTVWSGFFMGIFQNEYLSGLGLDGYGVYVRSLPFSIYPVVAVVMSLLVAVKVIPTLKAMKTFEPIDSSADSHAEDQAIEPKAYNFVLPLLITVIMVISLGGDIVAGLYIGILSACVLYMIQKIMSWEKIRTSFLEGAMTILPTVIMLFFTFTLVQINSQLGFTEYIVELAEPIMSANLLPVIIFIICSLICFSSGSFWGTSALITPIASALAVSTGAHVFLTLGAIVSGAVFGSSACLFGDVNILSAAGAGVKPIEHTLAQLPYCFVAWGITVAAFFILGIAL